MRHVRLMVLVLVSFLVAFATSAEPSIIIYNARIFTADPAKPFARAVAIEGNRIVRVGSDDEVRALATRKTREIDAQKRMVVPGLNDAHTHPTYNAQMFNISLGRDATWSDIRAAIAGAADETPGDIWISVEVGPQILDDPAINAASLQQLAGTRKVVLLGWTGHGSIFSSAALAALGVPANPTDPSGGRFGRDAKGAFDGRAFEYAQYPLMRKMAELASDEDLVDMVRSFADQAIGYGITSIQAMPGVNERRFMNLVRASGTPLRVRTMRFLQSEPNPPRMDAVKWILDGTPVERGAALRTASYANDGGRGRENFTFDELARFAKSAADAKQQLLVHAAGDKAVETALKVFAQAGSTRPRLEHGDGLQRDLIPLAKRTGAVVVQNPSHFAGRGGYPEGDYMLSRTLVDAGVPLAIGSDGPLNPWLNMMFAVDRRDTPSEALKREEVLLAYTSGSAFAEMKENEKGKIAAGMLADLAVLSQDVLDAPLSRLPETQSLLTIIDGRIVHNLLP